LRLSEIMNGHIHKFAGEFEGGTKSQWRTLAKAALRGAEFETLVQRSEDGIWLGPLFTKDDAQSEAALAKGSAPHLAGRPWHIDALIDHPDITNANKDILADLKGGASALTLKIDPSGKTGIALRDKADLQRLLAGVHADLVPISLLPSGDNFTLAALFAAHFAGHTKLDDIHLSLGYAPMILGGAKRNDLVALAKWVRGNAPHWRALSVDARLAHEQGASPAQELALMLAVGTTYIRILLKAGFSIKDALPLMDIYLASDQDGHQNILKLRAARLLWAKLAESFGADEPQRTCHIHATSSRRMMGRTDPWSNLIRLSAASFGAVLGGADNVTILPFTEALGLATPFARRISRNIALLQMEESHLGQVSDPAAGSYMHEKLTHELAAKAWSIFQHMESRGGWPECKTWFHREVAATHKERMAKIGAGEIMLVGVNQFAKPDIRKAEILRRPLIKPKSGAVMNAKTFAAAIKLAGDGAPLPFPSNPSGFVQISLTSDAEKGTAS